MKNLEKYLSEINTRLPDIEERLNAGADPEQLEKLHSAAGCALPDELTSLYKCFNGEDMSKNPCFFAGLQFLPIETLLHQLAFFQSVEEELTALGTRAIQEKPLCELNWIPFAYDCSRAWLALDLSPAQEGTVGQIIAVDYDTDHCYLLADSLEELLGKMTEWFQRGILTVCTEDASNPFIMENTGHLFNSLEKLAVTLQTNSPFEISLPEGFWQEKYGQPSVSVNRLEKEKVMRLFTLLGNTHQERPEEVRCQMEKYVRIRSWGTEG